MNGNRTFSILQLLRDFSNYWTENSLSMIFEKTSLASLARWIIALRRSRVTYYSRICSVASNLLRIACEAATLRVFVNQAQRQGFQPDCLKRSLSIGLRQPASILSGAMRTLARRLSSSASRESRFTVKPLTAPLSAPPSACLPSRSALWRACCTRRLRLLLSFCFFIGTDALGTSVRGCLSARRASQAAPTPRDTQCARNAALFTLYASLRSFRLLLSSTGQYLRFVCLSRLLPVAAANQSGAISQCAPVGLLAAS